MWGTACTSEQAETLADAVVTRFNRLVNESIPSENEDIRWFLGTSEVHGEYGRNYPDDIDEQLAECRQQAADWVMERAIEILDGKILA